MEQNAQITQDVRTILLSKIKPGNEKTYTDMFKNNVKINENGSVLSINNFITIGNYDSVMIFETSNHRNVLADESIIGDGEKDNLLYDFLNEKRALSKQYATEIQNPEKCFSFFHPLHIIRYGDSDSIKAFWDKESTCFAVVLIYGNTQENLDSESDKNEYNISKLEEDIESVINLPTDTHLLYRSVNISELVLVCKYDSLKSILENIAAISYKYPMLQTHTVCGFRYDISKGCISKDNISDKEEIPMVKVSGTIRSHKEAFQLFDDVMYATNIGEKYIAFGNNDFNLIYQNVKTIDIIDTLNACLDKHEDVKTSLGSKKTRVHLSRDDNAAISCSYAGDKNFQQLIKRVQTVVSKCQKAQPDHTEWGYTFIEALNMLADMCNRQELARIRYFVSDTLFVLEKTLNNILNNNELNKVQFFKKREELLNKFAEGFNTLIERIVRVDGYLSQEPGYSPLIYNMIPAGILEFYCSYIYTTIDAVGNIKHDSNTNKYIYSTLPLPALVNQIAFEDILPNFKEPDQRTQVNLLSIPYNQLYHSKNLLFASTHEIMHFCGEDIRCRDYRFECFINFLASFIIEEFNLSAIYDKALPHIQYYLKENITNDGRYFSKLEDEVVKNIFHTYQNVALKLKLQDMLYKHSPSIGKDELRYEITCHMNDISVQMSLLNFVHNIIYLFKECYADLMTIKILKIEGDDYCKLLDAIDKSTEDRDKNESILVESTVNLRKALVIYSDKEKRNTFVSKYKNLVVEKDGTSDNSSDYLYSNMDANFIVIVKLIDIFADIEAHRNCQEKCDNLAAYISGIEYDFKNLFYSEECIHAIVSYLRKCVETYDRLVKNKTSEVDKVAEYYAIGTSSSELFSDKYCKLIYDVRNTLFDQIKDAEQPNK